MEHKDSFSMALLTIATSLVLGGIAASAIGQVIPGKDLFDAENPREALDTRIASFTCANVRFSEFAHQLRQRTGIAVCCESSPENWNPDIAHPTVSLSLKDVSAREILNEAIRQNPAYRWSVTGETRVSLVAVESLADEKAWVNIPVASWQCDNKRASEVVSELTKMTCGSTTRLCSLGSFRSGAPPSKSRFQTDMVDRPVSFAIKDGTLLDALNALCQAVGDNVFWDVSGRLLFLAETRRETIETSRLHDARAYRQVADWRMDEAEALYLAAIADSPYTEHRAAIAVELAGLYMKDGIPPEKQRPEKAINLCESLLAAGLPGEFHKYHDMIRSYTYAMRAAGRSKEMGTFLLREYHRPPARARFPKALLGDLLLEHDQPGDADNIVRLEVRLRRLLAKRRLLPDNARFHNSLESSIQCTRTNLQNLRQSQRNVGKRTR